MGLKFPIFTIKIHLLLPVIIATCLCSNLFAQQDSTVDKIHAVLFLDSITIQDHPSSPNIKSMIRQMINDTTFYRAFQRLKRKNHRFSSELYFYKPHWKPHTYLKSVRDQIVLDGIRANVILQEKEARHMTDHRGNYKYYTARMYDHIFFTDRLEKIPKRISNQIDPTYTPASRMDKYVHDLKLLLFDPGSKINIPLMGNKTAIFTPSQMKYYNYHLLLDTSTYENSVYKFHIIADSNFSGNETIIKELITVFQIPSYQVISRSYRLKHNTFLYSFDVNMDIELTRHNGDYVPSSIKYRGWWDVPLKGAEWCSFSFQILEFL